MSIPQINNVGVGDVNVFRIEVPQIYSLPPATQTVPFILNIGSPVVDLPGCVEYHPDAADNRETPNLKEDDSNGTRVLCDGDYPTYNAMDYTPEDLNIYVETPPPVVEPPPDPPGAPETPDTGGLTEDIPCPGPAQLRVGDVTQSGDEKVVGHELQGTTCVTLYEPTSPVEKYIPPVNQVTSVTALAVVATAGAAATPLLIRVIRPVIKKVWTTVQKKLGKTPTKLTRMDIKTNQYRQSKGLPPLKK